MTDEKRQAAIDSYYQELPASLFPVSVHHGVIHVHIPKTAGTAMRRALFGSEVVKHVKARDVPLPFWEAFPSLTIVRHPMERFVSSFKYHVKSPYKGVLLRRHPNLKSMSIETYARKFVRTSELLATQTSYISRSDSDKRRVDHAIRFEDLNTRLPAILEELGIPVRLDAVKVGPKGPEDVPDQVRRDVEDFYREDYETFGY